MKYAEFKALCTEALLDFGLHSDHCVELLSMLAAHESHGGKFRRQLISRGGKLVAEGVARGLFGMEPETHDDTWQHCDSIAVRAKKHGIVKSQPDRMIDDDRYAIFMARHKLLMDPNPLPKTPQSMAEYAVKKWNAGGAASAEKYLNDWQQWRDGKL